ncbi:hypothetical protein EDI_245190 [Entamoeba dispar SAW760]|uniref:CUB domain-containing protein n=1 Tax=Entamoeba dispar (strain ATCC PRA-260 / SAW760) TaxID=370354 RepID=B0EE55_ENTDS|nr:uncharacterized protein EDI_245190 [Entamoeba dispar SAW760]EDR27179.1 hypothetical protein EDI_245190 [Entamoeba dispar SAW760]|eukprot:EDR27179.1 hypothetical protein EDI_245190 [Entamoeba dispar SAW760]
MFFWIIFIHLSFANTCNQAIPLEFYNDDNRFSFIQQPLTQELIMSYPGCGDRENRVTTWYRIENKRNTPLQIQVTGTSNIVTNHAKYVYVMHKMHLRVSSECPTSISSMGCVAQLTTSLRTSNITFNVPPNGHVFLATYEFLNNIEVQSHLFLQIKPLINNASSCQKADEVIFPLTQNVVVKTTDLINNVQKKGQWHRIASVQPGERYIIDTCSKRTTKPTTFHLFSSCNRDRIEEGYLRSCRDGVGSIVILNPSKTYSPVFLFVETDGDHYDIHFQKTTKKSAKEACSGAVHIPYIPYTIFSIPFAQYPLFINPCLSVRDELSTAFFGVTVHPNHEITMMTCGSQIDTYLTVVDSCDGKCLEIKQRSCPGGKIYTYTPSIKEGHSIIVQLSEYKKETFGRARLVFKEKEIGKKRDDEIHIGAPIRPRLNKPKNIQNKINDQENIISHQINQSNQNHFLSIVIVIFIGCAFLLGVAYFLTRDRHQAQYIPL